MTYEERVELSEKVKGMSRGQLTRAYCKAIIKLDTLSQICDVDDTYNALVEQSKAQKKNENFKSKIGELTEQVKYAKRYMIGALRRRGVECDKSFTLPQLTDLMIESDKNNSPD